MNLDSSAKMKDASTPTLHRIKTSEKQTEAENSAAKQVLTIHDNLTTRQKPLSKLELEKRIEQEMRRKLFLINEHNRLTFVVKEKEAKLKDLQESLKSMSLQPTNYKGEDTLKQHIRQLENNLDKMKMKSLAAEKIQTAYRHIHEHLQQEVRGMFKDLDQKEHAVAIGQAELDKASQHLRSVVAAADSAQYMAVQMENETMERKREMDRELHKLSAEEELNRQKEIRPRSTGQSRLRQQEVEEEELSIPKDPQYYDICGASQSDMKVVEDMETLRETLGCADVQDLVNKVMSQQATKKQLLIETTQHEEVIRQEAKTQADLELQYTELKFSVKPTATRFDTLKEQMQAKLREERGRVQRLQAELQLSQDLLDTVERGVDNIYFRMSCVPVERLPSASSTDSIDKLRDVRVHLPTLLQRTSQQKPDISGLDRDRVYSTLEKLNTMDLRINKRPITPSDPPQLSDDEEDYAPSREEIKNRGTRLTESRQNKKSSRSSKRKL